MEFVDRLFMQNRTMDILYCYGKELEMIDKDDRRPLTLLSQRLKSHFVIMAHPTLVDELWKSMPQFHTFHQQFWGPSGQKRIEDAQMGDKILRVDEDGMEHFKIIRATSGQIYLRQEMMRTLQRIKQAASSSLARQEAVWNTAPFIASFSPFHQ